MKKGLLSLLVVALTVVGCQDYDDQFDSLNKEILALKADLTSIKGLSTSITAISTEIKALEGKMVTDSDITGILTQIATVKAAVAALPAPADVSGISTEVADLNSEIATILEKLTKLAAATGGTYAGNLNITNLVQLTAAEDIVDVTTDGPLMTLTGNVNITAGQTDLKLAANLLRIQAILNKLKVISGSVTITGADSAMTADELLYITGSLDITGKSTFALPKLNTIDLTVDLDLYGDLSYPLLSSAGGVILSSTGTITTVDFSGLSTGGVTTAAGLLVLPLATSVKVGSLPASVTLAKAETVEAHGIGALGAMSMSAPLATAVTIKAATITGQVTLVADLANLTLLATSAAATTTIHAATVVADALTLLVTSTTISTTSLSAAALKTVNGTLTLGTATTAVFPALEALTNVFSGAAVTSFSAPKLVTSTGGNIDIKNVATGGGTISIKSLTAIAQVVDKATVAGITLSAQANDLVFDTFVKLATLDYTGTLIAGTLTASTTMVSLTTLTLGSTSKLTTLTVSATNMTALSTAGVILNTVVSNNTKLATLSFGHTHLDGQLATTVDIDNNDKLVALDMTTLGKVKAVSITGNASLTTFTAPSFANKAEPAVTIVVTFTGNDITGTYSATIAATETTPEVPYTSSSAAITSWKTFIDGYSSTNSVSFNLDIDRLLLGASTDGKYDDGKFSAGTAHNSNIDTAAELAKF